MLGALWEYLVITAGCAVLALAVNCFFEPNGISTGGFIGIAQIINRLFPSLPLGVTSMALNVPIYIMWSRKRGIRLLFSSLYAAVISSLMIDWIQMIHSFHPMEPLLASIWGGVLLGLSTGMLMLVEATTGGTPLLARLLKYKLPNLSIGRLCLITDVIVVIGYALTFRSFENALYGMISMYICSLVTDAVVYGGTNAKIAYIVSTESSAVTQSLLDMGLGVTLLNGRGGFSREERDMIFCTFRRNQITTIKATVTGIDPSAFIIVSEAREVLGNGFGAYSPDSL